MIIGNNNPNNVFSNHLNNPRNKNQNLNNQPTNSFENKWNKIQEYNENRTKRKNVFVKDIKEQHYTNSSNANQMHDKTLAMLHERLQNGTITLEEFNKRCSILGQQRQKCSKNNKLF